MAWKLEVAGVDRTTAIDRTSSPTIERPLNAPMRARFRIKPEGFLIFRFDVVNIYAQDGVTLVFGGFVRQRSVMSVPGPSSLIPTVEVDCIGYAAYADYASTSLAYTAPVGMSDVLANLITSPLSAYGLTLDGGQVPGPTLEPFAWDNTPVSSALRELAERASGAAGARYAYAVNPSGALKMFVVGTDAAPFNIQDTSTSHCSQIKWSDSDRPYVTNVIVTCGPDGPESVTQRWTADGVASSWIADIAVASGTTAPATVLVNAVTKTVGPGANYTWAPATATLTLGTAPLPTAGQIIELVYTAQFPFDALADNGSTPIREYRQRETEIRSVSAGQDFADGLLFSLEQQPLDFTVETVEYGGWDAGQVVQVILSQYPLSTRGFPLFLLIGNVRVAIETPTLWRYTLQMTEDTYQGSFLDRWRELIGATK